MSHKLYFSENGYVILSDNRADVLYEVKIEAQPDSSRSTQPVIEAGLYCLGCGIKECISSKILEIEIISHCEALLFLLNKEEGDDSFAGKMKTEILSKGLKKFSRYSFRVAEPSEVDIVFQQLGGQLRP